MPRYPPYTHRAVERAHRLRRDSTYPERLLWSRLRGRAAGLRFRRQHPVRGFIVDFYAPAARLVVEVDGRSHEGREAADAERTRKLRSFGLDVIRVTNDDVLADVDAVAGAIALEAARRMDVEPRPGNS
jgi:very-short-patch-repair endonuclease